MCRHCSRLIEDVKHKELVHNFMEALAEGVNRKLKEDHVLLYAPVAANDLEVSVQVNAIRAWKPETHDPAVLKLVYHDLTHAFE